MSFEFPKIKFFKNDLNSEEKGSRLCKKCEKKKSKCKCDEDNCNGCKLKKSKCECERCNICQRKMYKCECKNDEKCNTEVVEVIVVGGGNTGIPLTYLLTKDKIKTVCIEAGRNVNNDPNILKPGPLNSLEINFRNEYFSVGDAHYPTTQSGITSTNLHINHYDGGNVLGGSSSINDTIWWRSDANTFASAGGLFADVNYIDGIFKAVEKYTPFLGGPINTNKRGINGPIFVTQ